jgi:hypothetical protein
VSNFNILKKKKKRRWHLCHAPEQHLLALVRLREGPQKLEVQGASWGVGVKWASAPVDTTPAF